MYAYIETKGKQQKVESGQRILVDRIDQEPGSEVIIDKVLAVVKDGSTTVGTPYVEGASVKAEVVKTEKQDKVLVFKHMRRKNHRKLRGHRQQMTTLEIKDIKGI